MSKHLKSKSGKKCQLSGKAKMRGWSYSFLRSHFNPTAKRTFEVNLQSIKTKDENGTPITIKVAAKTMKRCPDIRVSINSYVNRKSIKRLKGIHKRKLLEELGLTA